MLDTTITLDDDDIPLPAKRDTAGLFPNSQHRLICTKLFSNYKQIREDLTVAGI